MKILTVIVIEPLPDRYPENVKFNNRYPVLTALKIQVYDRHETRPPDLQNSNWWTLDPISKTEGRLDILGNEQHCFKIIEEEEVHEKSRNKKETEAKDSNAIST